jgi:integrase
MAAQALEFAILTAARSGEVLGARWSEIDLEAKVWTVPATRIKAGREHRVPLSAPALAIIEAMQPVRVSEYVFPGYRPGRPLGDMALHMVLERQTKNHRLIRSIGKKRSRKSSAKSGSKHGAVTKTSYHLRHSGPLAEQ